MITTSPKRVKRSHRLGVLQQLHREEQGTALTEFVIVVPIFITIFIGMLNIAAIQRDAGRVQLRAYKQVWERAIPVQRSFNGGKHMLPPAAAATSLGLSNDGSSTLGNVQDMAKNTGLLSSGHFGESWALTKLPEASGIVSYDVPKGKAARRVEDLTDSKVVKELVSDNLGKPNFSGELASMVSGLITASGMRPALAAGIRYGSVQGRAEQSGTFMGHMGSYEVSAAFDVLVAPYAYTGMQHAITVAMSRFTVEGCKVFGTTLGIEFNARFKNDANCSSGGGGGGGF